MITLFEAQYEFLDDQKKVQSSTITFVADDPVQAVLAGGRFWINRKRNVPEHFHTLLCMKVNSMTFRKIGDMGQLNNTRGLVGYEWKVDTAGMSLVHHIAYWVKRNSP